MVLLEEATTDQFMNELQNRYPDFIFAGVQACYEGNTQTMYFQQGGGYVTRRGLKDVIIEHLSYETEAMFYPEIDMEDEDDD